MTKKQHWTVCKDNWRAAQTAVNVADGVGKSAGEIRALQEHADTLHEIEKKAFKDYMESDE